MVDRLGASLRPQKPGSPVNLGAGLAVAVDVAVVVMATGGVDKRSFVWRGDPFACASKRSKG